MAAAVISLIFDPLFATVSGGFIPVPFLRVLAYNESSLNPKAVTKSSHATGLFQVVPTVLKDYNLQHGTKYTLEDVKDPALNAKIGIELITRIVKSYQKNHPISLKVDWSDPRFVELLVQGFNAGYSEAGGVGSVVGKMEKMGIPTEQITADTVGVYAKKFKASKYLSMPERIRYAKAVAQSYFNELKREKPPEVAKTELPKVVKLSDLVTPKNEPVKPKNAFKSAESALPKKKNEVDSSESFGEHMLLISLPLIPLVGISLAKLLSKKRSYRSNIYG